jgi:hypothetical protein
VHPPPKNFSPLKLALKAKNTKKIREEKTYKTIETYPTSTLNAASTAAANGVLHLQDQPELTGNE